MTNRENCVPDIWETMPGEHIKGQAAGPFALHAPGTLQRRFQRHASIFRFAWQASLAAVAAAACMASIAAGICLFGGLHPCAWFPVMPYWCGAVLGTSLIFLSILAGEGCLWLAFSVHRSIAAVRRGGLSGVRAAHLQWTSPVFEKTARNASLAFLVCFVSGCLACAFTAGTPGFWHAWRWFVK